MSDFDQRQRVQRLRAGSAFRGAAGLLSGVGRGAGRRGGFDRGRGVMVRGAYRYHRGRRAKQDAGGKMKAHLKYISGERHKEDEREKRALFDDRGREQTSEQAAARHEGCFIEHRIIISPSARDSVVTEKDLHVLAQASIQEIRSRNPKAEVEASYAVHTDTDKPHAHLLITSANNLRITKEDYADLREMNRDLRIELERERQQGREHSHTLETALGHDQKFEMELGR